MAILDTRNAFRAGYTFVYKQYRYKHCLDIDVTAETEKAKAKFTGLDDPETCKTFKAGIVRFCEGNYHKAVNL